MQLDDMVTNYSVLLQPLLSVAQADRRSQHMLSLPLRICSYSCDSLQGLDLEARDNVAERALSNRATRQLGNP